MASNGNGTGKGVSTPSETTTTEPRLADTIGDKSAVIPITSEFICADCLAWLRKQPANSVDLIFCSPPYEAARTYGIDFTMTGKPYVDWCIERFLRCVDVSKGLVAWVMEGQTRNFEYSATPMLVMADLHRRDVKLRKPPIFRRVGIPGSGGPDWLRNDYESIVCASHGKLPWSDNTAMGHPPKYAPGGKPSHRMQNGERVQGSYKPPALANPGNVVDCGAAGGGNIGSPLAHENEAPFPEFLAEFFIRSFCPPGGTVLDIFSGSGTTVCVAKRLGRHGIGIDIREDQIELGRRRLAEMQLPTIA